MLDTMKTMLNFSSRKCDETVLSGLSVVLMGQVYTNTISNLN